MLRQAQHDRQLYNVISKSGCGSIAPVGFQNFVNGAGGGQAFNDGNERHPRAVALDDFPPDDIFQFVVVAFHQNIGAYFADQAFGGCFIKDGDVIDVLQGGQDIGPFILRIDGPPVALDGADRFVAVESEDQDIPLLFGLL